MIKEYSVHRLTDIIIATERERKVTDSSANMSTRKILFDPCGSFNEIYGIVIMFFDPCGYGKYIGVKNNIMRIKTYFIYQKTVSPFANFYFTGGCICLTFLIKSHYDGGRSILADDTGMFEENVLAFFQRNGVND